MANEEQKERAKLLQEISSMEEQIRVTQSEQASISSELVSNKVLEVEAAMKAKLSADGNLSAVSAMVKLDATRAMMAAAIADGTLAELDLKTQTQSILKDAQKMGAEEYQILRQGLKTMILKKKQMEKLDFFGKSHADNMKEANDAAKENTASMKDLLNSAGLIVDELASVKTLILAAVTGLAVATKGAFKLARALGTGSTIMDTMRIVGVQLTAQATALSRGFALSGDEARSAMEAIVGLNGSLKDATSGAVTSVGELNVKFGIAVEDAAKLNKSMALISENGQTGADAMMNQVKSLAKAQKVAPGPVLKDIAENAGEFARFGKDGASGLVNAAVNAAKLGLNLAKVAEAGDNLLDVQGSIKKEMKAEMLIGRQLNLDAARAAALSGDKDTLVKEIANNAGTMAEFEQMSVVQQRALADALGVQVGDVTKVLQAKQKGITLDSKVLENQDALTDASDRNALAASAVPAAFASLPGLLGSVIPSLAGIGQLTGKTFGGMKDSLFGMFSKSAEGAAEVSNKMEKIKTPKGGGKGMTNFFKSLGKIKASSMIKAALAIAIVAVSLIPAAYAFSLLEGVDPVAMAVFGLTMVGLALSLALIGSVSGPVIAGGIAFGIAALALIPAAFAMQMLQGVDPMAMLAFAASIGIMALAVAGLGLIAPLAIIGAGVLLVIGASAMLFASAFAAMQGVDPAAIDTLGAGIKSMIGIVEELGLVQAAKLVLKAAAIAALGLAILPFGMAIKAAGQGDATGLVTALKGLTEIPIMGLIMAGVGMGALALGFMAFLPISPFLGIMAESLAIITPSLALLAPLGEGLALAGAGVLAFGMGMLPLALGLMMAAPFIPLMPMLAEAFVIMTPPLVALAAIAEVMPLIGTGFMAIGLGLMPFAMGMAMLAPYIPLMPTMAESLVIMTPPLITLSAIADVLPTMGMGFMMLGMGLQSFAIAMAMIFPFQAVLPILAQTMIDLAPPLAIMAPLGPQIMYLATAIGALGVASAIATIPLFAFAAASYFAAPAVTLLGQASKILGAGLEMVRVPLLAMAQQAPQILLLSTGIMALGVSLLAATPPLFAFGASAWFAMIPVIALAGGLELMASTADGLTSVGVGLSSIAAGLNEISQFKGTMALLAIAAPAIALLGAIGMFGGSSTEESSGSGTDGANGEDGNQAASNNIDLMAKIDELISAVNSKDYEPVLMLDGRKVGAGIARKKGPKGMGN